MTARELAEQAGFAVAAGSGEKEIAGVYCGDLLSIVMSGAPEGCLWATIMVHRSVAAVAGLRDVACVLICGGMKPEAETLESAAANDITILTSAEPVYESVIRASKVLGLI